MAVLVRKRELIAGEQVELEIYLPKGPISETDRDRAKRLDARLRDMFPALLKRLRREGLTKDTKLKRWHALGEALREVADDPTLVDPRDRDEGWLWIAVRQHCPQELLPCSQAAAPRISKRPHKRKDHFWLCYEIGKFAWEDISWLRRWDDWQQILFRPAIAKDRRILVAMRDEILKRAKYPDRKAFREFVKELGSRFPTRQEQDTSVVSCQKVRQIVASAASKTLGPATTPP